MSDSSGQEAENQYDAGIKEVKNILFSLDATPDEKDAARRALDKLTALRLRVVIGRIEDRTKLLAGLIENLNRVIDSVQVTSPLKAVADRLTGIVGRSTTLLTSINTDFLGKGESTTPSG